MESLIWQHVKTKGLYRVMWYGTLESDMTPVVIYESLHDGCVWVRPTEEFEDGRFRNVSVEEIAGGKPPAMRLKPEQWLECPEFAGVTILDPDGWDRKNFEESWNKAITLDEMQDRTVRCTVQIMPNSPMHPRNIIGNLRDEE